MIATSPSAPEPDNGLLSSTETDAATEGVVTARSLVALRWISITGQLAVILLGYYSLKVTLPLEACLATVAAGLVLNVAATLHRRIRRRLLTHEAALYFAFDILQLALLMFLTGGLDNPFAIFLITPVAMAASMLRFWAVLALALLTLFCLVLNALWHLPLPWPYGSLNLPTLYGWAMCLTLSLAAGFIAAYSWSVAREGRRMRRALNATQFELAAANQMTAMGALAAAVAHELGTPLATISLVSKELLRDLDRDDEMRGDVELLVSQADRCRQVLADFARKPSAEGGEPYRSLPLLALVDEAAAPHSLLGIALNVTAPQDGAGLLMVRRRPELVHGLGNFVQNAFQFARSAVNVTLHVDGEKVSIIIEDDGPGFTAGLLTRIGEPYISTRDQAGAGHMGLGIFIAKTLLERTGARLNFTNRREGGARIMVTWPRKAALFDKGVSS
jgi:two-component system sensor histidine kinase RegB